jgi:hypothetical protein
MKVPGGVCSENKIGLKVVSNEIVIFLFVYHIEMKKIKRAYNFRIDSNTHP